MEISILDWNLKNNYFMSTDEFFESTGYTCYLLFLPFGKILNSSLCEYGFRHMELILSGHLLLVSVPRGWSWRVLQPQSGGGGEGSKSNIHLDDSTEHNIRLLACICDSLCHHGQISL